MCTVVYPEFRRYRHLFHLLSALFCPVIIPFEDCDVCVCIVALDVLAACKWLYVGEQRSSC